MKSIIVAGALANKCGNGGEAWVRLSWVRGLKRLGFQVYFLEQIASKTCVDAHGHAALFESSENLRYFERVTRDFGLAQTSALILDDGTQTCGLALDEIKRVCDQAELLINISGHLEDPWLSRVRRKAYVDIDPGFTQFWHADETCAFQVNGHDFYFTIGENIGASDCPIPLGGIDWKPARQPVVLEDWPPQFNPEPGRFTTVGSWRGPFGSIYWGNEVYGLKLHEWRKVMELPRRSRAHFEAALSIHPAEVPDIEALRANEWHLVEPQSVAATPESFRDYVQNSGAEFSVAQGVYVATNSGWFSDRTARYLASGKPALIQQTGWQRELQGEGLVTFENLEEAVAGAQSIARDYAKHSRAACALAESHFDSDKVLSRLLSDVGLVG